LDAVLAKDEDEINARMALKEAAMIDDEEEAIRIAKEESML
jgi:hypothetical protein